MAQTLNDLAGRLNIGDPQESGRLTICPVFISGSKTGMEEGKKTGEGTPEEKGVHYLLLEEALDKGAFEIGEVSDFGNVNTIVVTNMTGEPVLILDGEELVGAKQNRMINATIMVDDGKTAIPVSCVEEGRWRYEKEKFSKSEAFGYSTLRRQKAEQVSSSLQSDAGFNADQSAIWEEIDRTSRNLGAQSPTGAMHETYSSREDELSALVDNFEHIPGQVGLVVYINNRFSCLDLFDKSTTLEKLWTRLLKSYALESLNTRSSSLKNLRPEPAELKSAIETSQYLTYPSVSMGQDLRLTGPGIIGAGLVVEEELIHLSIFSASEEKKGNRSNIHPPQRRRRNLGGDDTVMN